MLTKRIIACLDVKDGRTVKGIQFESLKDMGDPVELARYYADEGIDELVFLDITATNEKRKSLPCLVKAVAEHLDIPFTVGGGISTIDDVAILLESGADKISINSAAIMHPQLIGDIAKRFGSQCIVVAVDAKRVDDDWLVYVNGGRIPTKISVKDWVKQAVSSGAGEILLTAIDNDGSRNGFAVELTRCISDMVNIPVIASGGAGKEEHFTEIFQAGKAEAALAAGIFHEKKVSVPALKQYLFTEGIAVRL